MGWCRKELFKQEILTIATALEAIKDWYGDEWGFEIVGITDTAEGNVDDFDQSEKFLSVRGKQWQVDMEGDCFQGEIYFEYEAGKFIKTYFYS